jgi:hypothetical protein
MAYSVALVFTLVREKQFIEGFFKVFFKKSDGSPAIHYGSKDTNYETNLTIYARQEHNQKEGANDMSFGWECSPLNHPHSQRAQNKKTQQLQRSLLERFSC